MSVTESLPQAPAEQPRKRRRRWINCPVCDGDGCFENRGSGYIWNCSTCQGEGGRWVLEVAAEEVAR